MPKRIKRHVSHLHHPRRHPRSFNFASGLIYAFAVMVSIALGALFYRGYRSARQEQAPAAPAEPTAASSYLPPGAKVVTRTPPEQKAAAPQPRQAPRRQKAPGPASPQPAAALTAPEPAPGAAEQDVPPLRHLPQQAWSIGYVDHAAAQEARIFPTADTCVVGEPAGARDENAGARTELLLKGTEGIVLAKYDTAKIRGWTLTKAVWHGKITRGRVSALGFSTVTADWEEGQGTQQTPASGGATFDGADGSAKPWREDGAPVTAVVRGNNQSVMTVGRPAAGEVGDEEWAEVPLDPVVVQALVAGASYGLAITDEKGQLGTSAFLASREDTNNCHFIDVQGAFVDIAPPDRVLNLKAYAHPALRRADSVGALLTWTAPGDDAGEGQAFYYDLRYAPAPATFDRARQAPRSVMPHPQPSGQPDQVVIEGLEPETTYTFFLRAVDESGQAGPVADISLKTGPVLERDTGVAAPPRYEATPIDVASRAYSLRMFDEAAGVDPVSGSLTEDSRSTVVPPGSEKSQIWERGTRTLHLRAARNEVVGFLIDLQRSEDEFLPLGIAAEPFKSTKGVLANHRIAFSRVWYSYAASSRGFRWRGDALLPIQGEFKLEKPPSPIPEQLYQTVYAELHVPTGAQPGTYRGQLVLTRPDHAESKLNILLDVLPLDMPAQPRFTIELPVPAAIALLYKKDLLNRNDTLPVEEGYQRLARDHRCTTVFLPYLRNGTFTESFAPAVTGRGIDLDVTSWDEWDAHYVPFLSGRGFKGADQGEQPVSHILLPVFDNWPTRFEDGFTCEAMERTDPAQGFKVYAGPADDIYGCLDSDYWRALRRAVAHFRDHLQANGGRQTAAHVGLMNGPAAAYSGKAPPWFLGEPRYRDDFVALEAFAQVAMADVAAWPPGLLRFRVAVPDAAGLARHGERLFSLLTVSDTSPQAWHDLRRRAAVFRETLWLQTGVLPLEETTLEIPATALRYFLEGADGWSIAETVGVAESWPRTHPPALFYCGAPLGQDEPFPSRRLKALRRAEQDIEYLLMLQEKKKWTREQLADFVRGVAPAVTEGSAVSSAALYRLRYTVQEMLMRD